MLRLLRFLLTGDWHLHKWQFTHVSVFNFNTVQYVKVCKVCGKHETDVMYNCKVKHADDLNLKEAHDRI